MRVSYLAAGVTGFIAATVVFIIYAFAMGIIALDQQLNLYGLFVAVGVCLALAAAAVAQLLTRKTFEKRRPRRLALAMDGAGDQQAPLDERAEPAAADANFERAA